MVVLAPMPWQLAASGAPPWYAPQMCEVEVFARVEGGGEGRAGTGTGA